MSKFIDKLKRFISENAETQGFYGFALQKIDAENQWSDLAALMQLSGVVTDDDISEYLQVFNYFRHCDVLTYEIPCKTYFGWTADKRVFSDYAKQFDQVSERLYWYFLEILPPIEKTRGFMVSEAYSYCDECNQNTYATFCNKNGKHYFLGYIAPKKYNAVFEQLNTI